MSDTPNQGYQIQTTSQTKNYDCNFVTNLYGFVYYPKL